jgi:chaperone modulatory protein CbpM
MTTEITDAQWLHEHAQVSIEELAQLSGLAPVLLRELVDCGALTPVDSQATQWTFTSEYVVSARTANRLREDFDLDANALSVALNLIERIYALEGQLRELRSQFPHTKVKR